MSHRAPSTRRPAARLLVRAAIALSAAGTALAAGSSAAQAASAVPGVSGVLGGAAHGLGDSIGPVEHLKLNPMAGTTVNPLTNAVGTQIADFKPVGTQTLTGPLADGDSLSELPLLGGATHLLPS
jgi:hypothetical protein